MILYFYRDHCKDHEVSTNFLISYSTLCDSFIKNFGTTLLETPLHTFHRGEDANIENSMWPADNNPLFNSPHTRQMLIVEKCIHPCNRHEVAFTSEAKSMAKYWPPVARIDNVFE